MGGLSTGSVMITFDVGKATIGFGTHFREAFAAEVAHEGRHADDRMTIGAAATRDMSLATERRAFSDQSHVFEGLKSEDHEYRLWDPGWSSANAEARRSQAIESNAQNSATDWCTTGGRNVPGSGC